MQFDTHDPWARDTGYYGSGVPMRMQPGPAQAAPPPPGTVPTPPGAGQDFVPAFDYQTPAYGGPKMPTYATPKVPVFNGPQFHAPDASAIYNDPSYKFRLSQGLGALDASAAAKGNLKTGGHLKDFNNYAQDYASQEWQNMYNRAVQNYGLDYTRSKDMFAPQLLDYSNKFSLAQDQGNRAFDNGYDQWKTGLDDEFRREQMLSQLGIPQ